MTAASTMHSTTTQLFMSRCLTRSYSVAPGRFAFAGPWRGPPPRNAQENGQENGTRKQRNKQHKKTGPSLSPSGFARKEHPAQAGTVTSRTSGCVEGHYIIASKIYTAAKVRKTMNRVPLILVPWFVLWTTMGFLVGRSLDIPGVYTTLGVVFAVVSIFSWPFIFPERLQDWMEQ